MARPLLRAIWCLPFISYSAKVQTFPHSMAQAQWHLKNENLVTLEIEIQWHLNKMLKKKIPIFSVLLWCRLTSCRRSARLAKQAKKPPIATSQSDNEHSSAIAKHLIESPLCAKFYDPGQFSIIASARTDFHLKVLEAVFIQSFKPVLCRQKTFVYECLLFWALWFYILLCFCFSVLFVFLALRCNHWWSAARKRFGLLNYF